MLVPEKSLSNDCKNFDPGSVIDMGTLESGPAMAERNKAQSETFLAIGPETEIGPHPVLDGKFGTLPGDGRNPITLQKFAGFLREPPVSLPSAIGNIRVASATAAPPLLPPQVLETSYGFRVSPNTSL